MGDAVAPALRDAALRSGGSVRLVGGARGAFLIASLADAGATLGPALEGTSAALERARTSLAAGVDELIAVDPRDAGNVRKLEEGRYAHFRAGGGIPRRYGPRILRCGGGCGALVMGGVARTVLRRAIRRSVAPRVRACFRDARGGRPDFEARVLTQIVVVSGEVVAVQASGPTPALESCVERAFDDLELPSVEDEVVTVAYPFVAARYPQPAPIPLADETRAAVDAVLEGAVLEGAVLEGAVLEGAVLESAVLEDTP